MTSLHGSRCGIACVRIAAICLFFICLCFICLSFGCPGSVGDVQPGVRGGADGGGMSDRGGAAAGGSGAASAGSAGTGGMGGLPVSTDPNDPLNKVVTCTSGRFWSGANGDTMYPGDRCQGCHIWEIAGTVYPTGHEQTLCNGQDGSELSVVVSDSAGRIIDLIPNSVGNFYYRGVIAYPFTAKVVRGSAVRAMATPQTNGECNACHTPDGIQGAPGRIVPPL
jgi:hypothetical protein